MNYDDESGTLIGLLTCKYSVPEELCTVILKMWLAALLSGNGVASINEVNLRRAGLLPRWVTDGGCIILVRYLIILTSHLDQLSLANPSLRR